MDIFTVPSLISNGTYLGYQNIDHKRTMREFIKNKEKICNKLASWKVHALSHASKMMLTKSNLTGIPLFTMHGIKFPNNIFKEIDSTNRYFFL